MFLLLLVFVSGSSAILIDLLQADKQPFLDKNAAVSGYKKCS